MIDHFSRKPLTSTQQKNVVILYGEFHNPSADPSAGPIVGYASQWEWKKFLQKKNRSTMMSVYEADKALDQREGVIDPEVAKEATEAALARANSNKIYQSRREDEGYVEPVVEDTARGEVTMNVEDCQDILDKVRKEQE